MLNLNVLWWDVPFINLNNKVGQNLNSTNTWRRNLCNNKHLELAARVLLRFKNSLVPFYSIILYIGSNKKKIQITKDIQVLKNYLVLLLNLN